MTRKQVEGGYRQISAHVPMNQYEIVKKWGVPWCRIISDGIKFQDQELKIKVLESMIEDLKKNKIQVEKANLILQNELLRSREEMDNLTKRGLVKYED